MSGKLLKTLYCSQSGFLHSQAEAAPADDPLEDDAPLGDDQPMNEAPGDDAPGDDEPGNDEPGNDEPGNDEPGNDEPGNKVAEDEGEQPAKILETPISWDDDDEVSSND